MLRLTIKNLAANRLRFAMTTFAVVLAVSFVVSSFVLTDGLRSTFGDLSGEIVSGTDLEVRPVDEFGEAELLDESLVDQVASIDGVAAVAAVVEAENTIRPINGEGQEISSAGPPQLAFGWVDSDQLTPLTLVEGEAPDAAGEFSMDLDSAANNGFSIGGTYSLITPNGLSEATLVGITSFGEDNATLGATLMQFERSALQDLIGQHGLDGIQIALEPGVDQRIVQAEIAALAPAAEVVDNATLESEQQADFNQGIDLIGNILLGFAGVSLFVSIFIIYNTFSIVLGQRTKEMALLRTIGADPVQLRRSVQAEAVIVGVIASAIGILAGVGVAYGLRGLFGALGAQLPDTPLIISSRTVIVAAVVGIGVTLVSAVGPARKAARVPAIEALRDGATAGDVSGRTRLLAGSALLAVSVATGIVGLFVAEATASIIVMLAVGAIGFFVGVTLLSPLVVGPLTAALGWPVSRTFGVAGRLAEQNAGRNPQRTATTAAALMIGLAMVSMALTVGESVKAQLRSTLASSVQADYLINEANAETGFPPTLAADFEASPVTETVTSFRYDEAEVAGVIQDVMGTDLVAADELFDFEILEGVAVDPSVIDPILVSNEEAAASLIEVGDVIPVRFPAGADRDMTVIGVFGDDVIIEEAYLFDLSTWSDVDASAADGWLALSLVDGITNAEADAAFASIQAAYPQADIDTANAFVERLEGFVDQALTAVNVMVALAVVIALIGIANTLALSVFERTRELGLLRAVGMTRRQLRRMVRFEAGLVALFGATLGVSVGVFFAWAAVLALPASFTSTLAVPFERIAILVAVAAVAGLVAAWGPARRAGKLDVLKAIAT